jgi:uncharacterized protein YacL
MLVEALRLIVVLAAVLAANRLAVSNPNMLGDLDSRTTVLVVTILGAGIAYVAGGAVARGIERLLHGTEEHVSRRHASELIASTVGVLIGAVFSSLIAWPILVFVRPVYVGGAVAAFVAIIVITFTTRLAVRKRLELFGVLGVAPLAQTTTGGCLLDSSAAIDGRVLALYRAGLLPQPLCVPSFIIWEMQGIADSGDPMRRRRGRRGLDMLGTLREAGVEVRVLDEDPAGITEPDAKLVVIARRRGLPIVTSDTNLAKAAELQGVGVLNLHRLADLVRPPVAHGERIRVTIVRKGREVGQGIAYLDDGTMVVVEGASERQGAELDAEVTSVIQQDTGRIVFAKIADVPPEPGTTALREAR